MPWRRRSAKFFVYTRDLLPTLTAHPSAMLEVVRSFCEKIRVAATIIEDNKLEMRWRTARGFSGLHTNTGARRPALRYSSPFHRKNSDNIWERPNRTSIGSLVS